MKFDYQDYLFRDLHKDALGYRPTQDTMQFWNNANEEVKQIFWNGLCEQLSTVTNEQDDIMKDAMGMIDDCETYEEWVDSFKFEELSGSQVESLPNIWHEHCTESA